MRAVVLHGGKLDVRETADPVPGPGELLIKPLSGGDLRVRCALHGPFEIGAAVRVGPDRGTVMGHEFIGRSWGTAPTARTTSRSAPGSPACRSSSGPATSRW